MRISTLALVLSISLSLVTAACGGGDSGGGTPTVDMAIAPDLTTPPTPILPDGEYFLGLELAPFSGLKLHEKLVITASGDKGKAGAFKKVELYALGTADPKWQSDKPIATLTEQPIDAAGKFKLDFGTVTLPGMASPTGSDVQLTLLLTGTISDDHSLCGAVDGMVPAFKADLAGSAFKAVPFGMQKDPYETACTAAMVKTYEHIKMCPAIKVGSNTMTSAEIARNFEVRISSKGAPQAPVPLVFLYHGVGGSPAGILQDTQYEALLGRNEFVLVAPESAKINGMAATLDWEFELEHYDLDNRDLVFFDDLVTCLSMTYKVDPKRIYVTGMSGGGLMSTFLAANRSKVVAAAAPCSGGYLFAWPMNASKTPMMVTWGGPSDMAFQQNFNTLAMNLLGAVTKAGDPLVKCEHTLGHKWPPEITAATWAYLSAFTLGGGEKPFSGPLMAPFPGYCSVVQ